MIKAVAIGVPHDMARPAIGMVLLHQVVQAAAELPEGLEQDADVPTLAAV
jgi:hypothetical protein